MLFLWSISCLSPLGSFVGLDHEISLLVGAIFFFPDSALVAEFVHLAGIDGSVLLTSRETHHPQRLEGEWGNSLLEGSQILIKEFEYTSD